MNQPTSAPFAATSCAQCGKRIHRGKNSWPAGQARCRACRYAEPRGRECEVCETRYTPTYSGQRTCGRTCGLTLRRTVTKTLSPTPRPAPAAQSEMSCEMCSGTYVGYPNKKTCSAECSYRRTLEAIKARYKSDREFRDKVLSQAHARRADKLGKGSRAILLSYLIDRDKRCQAVDCKYKNRRMGTGGRRPSIDHIIPLSKGGDHDLANVALTHYACNLAKNNRGGGEQLALVG